MTEIPPLDTATVETLKGLMKDGFPHLIETFLTSTTQQYGDLKAAIETQNVDEVVKLLHMLKGSSGSVGALSLHDKSRTFESIARAGNIASSTEWMEQLTIEFENYKNEIKNYL